MGKMFKQIKNYHTVSCMTTPIENFYSKNILENICNFPNCKNAIKNIETLINIFKNYFGYKTNC